MTTNQLPERFAQYIDGTLTDAEANALHQHLAHHPAQTKAFLEQLRIAHGLGIILEADRGKHFCDTVRQRRQHRQQQLSSTSHAGTVITATSATPIRRRRSSTKRRSPITWPWYLMAGGLAAAAMLMLRAEPTPSTSTHPSTPEIVGGSLRHNAETLGPGNFIPSQTTLHSMSAQLRSPSGDTLLVQQAQLAWNGPGDWQLDSGSATISVTKRTDDQRFVVASGNLKAEVLGTKFQIKNADQINSIAVYKGKVGVTDTIDNSYRILSAGEEYRSTNWIQALHHSGAQLHASSAHWRLLWPTALKTEANTLIFSGTDETSPSGYTGVLSNLSFRLPMRLHMNLSLAEKSHYAVDFIRGDLVLSASSDRLPQSPGITFSENNIRIYNARGKELSQATHQLSKNTHHQLVIEAHTDWLQISSGDTVLYRGDAPWPHKYSPYHIRLSAKGPALQPWLTLHNMSVYQPPALPTSN